VVQFSAAVTERDFSRRQDQGQDLTRNTGSNPLSPENLSADHGRGSWLMRVAMDEVSWKTAYRSPHAEGTPRQPRTERRGTNEIPSLTAQAGEHCAPLSAGERLIRQTKEVDVLKIKRTETGSRREMDSAWPLVGLGCKLRSAGKRPIDPTTTGSAWSISMTSRLSMRR